jgi:hypothetical protein
VTALAQLPNGTRFYAHPAHWERQWIRFDEDKVTERIRVKVTTRKSLPERKALSNPELEDTKEDPWSLQNILPLENVETGELVLFTSSTTGGKIGIEELAKAYSEAVLNGTARGLPIIELGPGTFPSSFGKEVPRPAFPIVDWENAECAAPAAPEVIPPEKLSKDLNDDIPF